SVFVVFVQVVLLGQADQTVPDASFQCGPVPPQATGRHQVLPDVRPIADGEKRPSGQGRHRSGPTIANRMPLPGITAGQGATVIAPSERSRSRRPRTSRRDAVNSTPSRRAVPEYRAMASATRMGAGEPSRRSSAGSRG